MIFIDIILHDTNKIKTYQLAMMSIAAIGLIYGSIAR